MRSKQGQKEFQFQLMALAVIVVLVHAGYALLIRHGAESWAAAQAEVAESESAVGKTPPLVIILKDYEQEACVILFLWALSIMGYKARQLKAHTALLEQDFVQVQEGHRILPEDAR